MRMIAWDVRAAAYRRLIAGGSAENVAGELGVGSATLKAWARLAGMRFKPARTGGGVVRMPMDAAAPCGSGRAYRRLTLADRSFIQAARTLSEPMSMRRIVAELGGEISFESAPGATTFRVALPPPPAPS